MAARAKVLLVDDVADLRFLFRGTLERDGRFEVVGEAANGREAIDMAGELRPDLILLDIAMPIMDGIQAIPHLHRASPGTRIVMVSGFESNELAQQAINACATEFIEKGTPLVQLVEAAHRVAAAPPKACAYA